VGTPLILVSRELGKLSLGEIDQLIAAPGDLMGLPARKGQLLSI
jgi:hypothetical protein